MKSRTLFTSVFLLLSFILSPVWAEEVTEDSLKAELESLKGEEQVLETTYKSLVGEGWTPEQVTTKVEKLLESASSEERAILTQTDKRGNIAIPEGHPLSSGVGLLKAAGERFQAMNDAYDQHQLKRTQFLMRRYLFIADSISSKSKKAEEFIADMKENYEAYLKSEDKFGTPQDRERSNPFKNFFKAFDKLASEEGSEVRTLSEKLNKSLDGVRGPAKNLPFVKALPSILWNYALGKPVLPGVAPKLNRAISRTGKTLEKPEIAVDVSNPGKKVRLLALPHSNKLYDAATVANLGGEHSAFVMNPNFDIPKSLHSTLRKIDDAVMVGIDPRHPMDDLVKKIEAGKTDVIIFPEGNMGVGITENRPGQRSFSKHLVRMLRQKGIEVEVVPIGLPNHPQMGVMDGSRNTSVDGKDLRVDVRKAIPADVVALMSATGQEQILSNFVRQEWFGSHQEAHGEDRVMGSPRIEKLKVAFDESVAAKFKCQGLAAKIAGLGI